MTGDIAYPKSKAIKLSLKHTIRSTLEFTLPNAEKFAGITTSLPLKEIVFLSPKLSTFSRETPKAKEALLSSLVSSSPAILLATRASARTSTVFSVFCVTASDAFFEDCSLSDD